MWINGKDIYLISPSKLKERKSVDNNVDDAYVIRALKSAQDVELIGAIGRELVTKLCQLVESGQPIPEKYAVLINQYVMDYLGFMVASELTVMLWGKSKNEGVVNTNGTEFNNVAIADCNYVKEYWRNKAVAMIEPMKQYLCNADIPEWRVCAIREQYQTHIVL